jgi:hypothetical protein
MKKLFCLLVIIIITSVIMNSCSKSKDDLTPTPVTPIGITLADLNGHWDFVEYDEQSHKFTRDMTGGMCSAVLATSIGTRPVFFSFDFSNNGTISSITDECNKNTVYKSNYTVAWDLSNPKYQKRFYLSKIITPTKTDRIDFDIYSISKSVLMLNTESGGLLVLKKQ